MLLNALTIITVKYDHERTKKTNKKRCGCDSRDRVARLSLSNECKSQIVGQGTVRAERSEQMHCESIVVTTLIHVATVIAHPLLYEPRARSSVGGRRLN